MAVYTASGQLIERAGPVGTYDADGRLLVNIQLPFAQVRRGVVQALPGGVTTVIVWDTEDFDTDNFWSVVNAGRFTIPYNGVYLLHGSGYLPTVGSIASLLVNGGAFNFQGNNGAAGNSIQALRRFIAGDYVQMAIYAAGPDNFSPPNLFSIAMLSS